MSKKDPCRASRAIRKATMPIVEALERRRLLSGSISGTVWEDLNGDGLRSDNEPPLPDWTVYLDQNRNRVQEPDEPVTRSDANGQYLFADLAPGRYYVAQVVQPGWEQSAPGAAPVPASPIPATISTTASDVEAHISGVASPLDPGDASVQPADAQSGPLIRLDAMRNDSRFRNIDGRGYSIAVLDTGIDIDHSYFGPDSDGNGIADRIIYQYDFADGDADASTTDSHGSNVTGVAAGSGTDHPGMAPGASILALKVFSNSGVGYFSYIESALQWVVANAEAYNIAAVNMSLSDTQNHMSSQQLYGIADELAALAAKDVIVVSAAGNEYASFQVPGVGYPAADPNSLAVGAVYDADVGNAYYGGGAGDHSTASDRIASFSQRSPTLTDVFAPGARITSANAYGGLITYSGTSQAAPHVTGLAVLAQQMAGEMLGRRLSPVEYRDLIRSSGVTIFDGDDEDDNVVNTNASYQRIDVLALAEAIAALRGDGYPTGHAVTLADGGSETGLDFGNEPLPLVLAMPDLQASYDTGVSQTDNITRNNNSTASRRLGFRVSGTRAGGTVTLYADGLAVATVPTVAGSTLIMTDGTTRLDEGQHSITARQTISGRTSELSAALTISVDSVAAPAPAPVRLDPASDSGVSSSDGITTAAGPTFVVSAPEEGIIRLRVDNSSTYSARYSSAAGDALLQARGSIVTLGSPTSMPHPGRPNEIAAGDFNGDGVMDFVVTSGVNSDPKHLNAYLGNGDGTFLALPLQLLDFWATDLATGDFNEDGRLDLLIAIPNTATSVVLMLGNGDGTFRSSTRLDDGGAPSGIATADLNGDGHLDAVITQLKSGATLRVLLGRGDGTFADRTFDFGLYVREPHLADLDADGQLDVIAALNDGGRLHAMNGRADGTFDSLRHFSVPPQPMTGRMTVGDFDGDGAVDAVAASGTGLVFLRNDGDGNLSDPHALPSVGGTPWDMVAADFNDDGYLDIGYVAGSSSLGVLVGTGDGSFAPPAGSRVLGTGYGPMAVADFNDDGAPDVLSLGSSLASVVLTSHQALAEGQHTVSATFEDLAGNVSPASPSAEFYIDTTAPAASFAPISPDPRTQPLATATFSFNEPVHGLGISDLTLHLDGGPDLLDGTQALASSDGRTYVLSGLENISGGDGTYTLRLHAAGSGIIDLAGNALAADALVSWMMNAGTQQTTTYLSDLTWSAASSPYSGIKKDKATGGGALRIAGTAYDKGLGVHSPSSVTYALGGQYNRFTALVGIDDLVNNNGSAVFEVWVDGVLTKASTRRTGATGAEFLEVDLAGAQQLRLVTTTGGDSDYCDHANWADAKLYSGAVAARPAVSVSASDASAAETLAGAAANTGSFTFTRSGDTTVPLTIHYTLGGSATAGSDYTTLNGSVTIPAGAASAIVTLTPIDDVLVEGSETAVLTLAASDAYTIGTPATATVTIADNDTAQLLPTVTLGATGTQMPEGYTRDNQVGLTFTRTGSTAAPLTVHYTLTGTATAGVDYSVARPMTIPAGYASFTAWIDVLDDAIAEPTETIVATLSTDAAYSVGTAASVSVQILDNDQPSTGESIYLSQLNWSSATSPYSGVKKDRATSGNPLRIAGTTYDKGLGVHSPSSITYSLGGQYTQFVSYVGIDDLVDNNGSAVFEVWVDGVLKSSTRRTGSDGAALVEVDLTGAQQLRLVTTTGGDSDYCDHANWASAKLISGPVVQKPSVGVSLIGSAARSETSGTANTFRISRFGATDAPLTVLYSTGGTATAGSDYQPLSGTLTLAAGQASVDLPLSLIDDSVYEGDETVILTLMPQSAYAISTASATITVLDDETPPVGQTTYLSDLSPTSAIAPFGGVTKDRAISGNPLRIGGTTYARGIGVHSHSEVTYMLGGQYSRFTSYVGIDDAVGNGSMDGSAIFQVWVDGVLVKSSSRLTGAMGAEFLDVNVAGAQTLKLVTTTGGDNDYKDHADWADARLLG